MDKDDASEKTPWQLVPLSSDHLHPLAFLRPDVVLHVHDLWKSGTHDKIAYRTFSLPDVTDLRSFVMMGVSACGDFIKSWRINREDVQHLSGLESLAELPPEFWDYLTQIPHFTGSFKALPEGTLIRRGSIKVMPEDREANADPDVRLDLVVLKGPAAELALVSETFGAIIDYSIAVSADLVADQEAGFASIYYETERELHPFWAKLAATIESIIANEHPLEKRLKKIWLWHDDPRDSNAFTSIQQTMKNLESLGLESGVLTEMRISR